MTGPRGAGQRVVAWLQGHDQQDATIFRVPLTPDDTNAGRVRGEVAVQGAAVRRPALPAPVIDVELGGHGVRVGALLDTGSLHNRFGRWIAEAIGVDLTAGEPTRFAVAGIVAEAVTCRSS